MKNTGVETFLGCVGGITVILLVPVIIIGYLAWESFVFMKLWNWFVVTQFGLAPLAFFMACGINLLISLATDTVRTDKHKDETTDWSIIIGYVVIRPAITLGLGYLIFTYFI